MEIEQRQFRPETGWSPAGPSRLRGKADLVLAFGSPAILRPPSEGLRALAALYPDSALVGCSTAGEICGVQVSDETLVATAVRFDATRVRVATRRLDDGDHSAETGRELARDLAGDGLGHLFVLSDGLHVNGSALVRGLLAGLPDGIQVTGGLAGDGARFGETLVFHGPEASTRNVVAIGFYGDRLRVGYGSLGGWDPFGPERLVTRSKNNVLYELDGRSALELYKTYLGEYARDLPATALLFPLSLRFPDGETGVVRTVLSINEREQTMTFAGDLPEGCFARLMKANFERLIDGATTAARQSVTAMGDEPPDLAVLISCVGRKMVLGQRIEEEVESVREIVGDRAVMAGFYSYGEISPFTPSAKCELHNQTMTITTLSER